MRRGASAFALALWLAATALHAQAPPGWDQALTESQRAIGRSLEPDGVGGFALRDALGRSRRLADYRGKPLVVSFVYTGCFQACPVATQALAKAVRDARAALGADSFDIVSIGFNQPFDSPEAMAAFARQNRVGEARWSFLAARTEDVPALTRAFGFSYSATPKGFDHITQATIVDARGMIAAQVYGDAIELPQFVGPLKSLIAGEAAQVASIENIWLKVKLYCTVYDPVAGRYRLNYSLFFEIFCGLSVLFGLGWFMARELRGRRLR